jgi:hypothetical protein
VICTSLKGSVGRTPLQDPISIPPTSNLRITIHDTDGEEMGNEEIQITLKLYSSMASIDLDFRVMLSGPSDNRIRLSNIESKIGQFKLSKLDAQTLVPCVTIMDSWAVNYVFLFAHFDPDSLHTHSDCHEVTYAD